MSGESGLDLDAEGTETFFVCSDCGVETYSFGLIFCVLPVRCGVCTWLCEWVPPEHHAAYRARAGLSENGSGNDN